MSNKQEITSALNDVWGKLNARWRCEDSNAFYQQYIAKMTEAIEDFEEACSDLRAGAADLLKKIELIEHDIT